MFRLSCQGCLMKTFFLNLRSDLVSAAAASVALLKLVLLVAGVIHSA